MIEARRLLEAGTDRERALLRAGTEESPTSESVRAAARILGLVPRAALLASLATLLAKGANALKGSWFNGYVLAPALIAGAMTTTYAVTAHRRTEAAAALAPASPKPLSTPAAPSPETLHGSTEPALGAIAPAVPDAVTPRAARVGARARDAASASFTEQVTLIDHARALMASGDVGGALRAVDAYEHRFPRGLLAEEAALLRIQAASGRGDRATAIVLAQRFRAEYPRSVHADKIERLLGDGASK